MRIINSQFQDGQVDRRVQSQTTLVGSQSGVELHSVTPVDRDTPIIALPGDPELDDTLGDLNHSEGATVLWVFGKEGFKGGSDFSDGLEISNCSEEW